MSSLSIETTEARELFERLVREANRGWNDDNPFAPGPQPGRFRRQLVALGEEVLPVLERELDSERPTRRNEAASVLVAVAATGGPTREKASDLLFAAAADHPARLAVPCFRVDPDETVALGLHVVAHGASRLLQLALDSAPHLIATMLPDILNDDDAMLEVVRPRSSGVFDRIAMAWPEAVPLERLEAIEQSDNEALSVAARNRLECLSRPRDRARLLDARQVLNPGAAVRFGSHPKSIRLFDLVKRLDDSVLQLVLRRACAGLESPENIVRPHVANVLRGKVDWRRLRLALRVTHVLGWQALSTQIAARLRTLRRSPPIVRGPESDLADKLYRNGAVDTGTPGSCSFLAYATELFATKSASAAFQLAWIDRAFGAQPDSDRISWIRSLGFHDRGLLDELAAPPQHALAGYRHAWTASSRRTLERDKPRRSLLARRAEEVGLFGLAAELYRVEVDEARCREACEQQLKRVRAGSQPPHE